MTVSSAIQKLQEVLRQLNAWRKPKPRPPVKANPKGKPAPKPPAGKAGNITMYDSIEVGTVPPKPEAVAGYTDGKWQTYKPLVQAFPRAHHLSIAVFPSDDAECLDIENGDATPEQAPAWVRKQHARGISRPVVYSSLSAMPTVLAHLAGDSIPRRQVRVWTAHYTYRPHLCSAACGFGFTGEADATQYTDHALNRNLDASLCKPTFFQTGGH